MKSILNTQTAEIDCVVQQTNVSSNWTAGNENLLTCVRSQQRHSVKAVAGASLPLPGSWDAQPFHTASRKSFATLGSGPSKPCVDVTVNGYHNAYNSDIKQNTLDWYHKIMHGWTE